MLNQNRKTRWDRVSRSFSLGTFLLFMLVMGPWRVYAQPVAIGDSLDLIGILNANCSSCSLNDPNSSNYWDTLQPVIDWPGVTVNTILGAPRVTEINLNSRGLTGDLAPLTNCDELTILRLYNNQLTALLSLSGCTALEELNCNNNQLDSLPSLAACTALKWLHCSKNHLDSFPSLAACTALEELNCNENHLDNLPSLDSCTSLKDINCNENHLTSLPSLSKCTSLVELRCFDNRISSLPTLDSCALLRVFHCGRNQINQLQSLDNLPLLRSLHCQQNNLDSLPSLDQLMYLEDLHCEFNQLTSLPSLRNTIYFTDLHCQHNDLDSLPYLNHCARLFEIRCDSNNLSWLPRLDSCPLLSILRCEENNLNFSHLEFFVGIDSLVYTPQYNTKLDEADSVASLTGVPYVLDASFTSGVNNQYRWFYHPNQYPDTTSDLILNQTDSTHSTTQSGWYSCEITNLILSDLTLLSDPLYLEFDEGVRCGNTNLDTSTNMLDLAMIGLNFGERGPPRDPPLLNSPNPEAALIWRDANGDRRDYTLLGDTINLKHADCNGDGVIDEADVSCIQLHYDAPYNPQSYLANALDTNIRFVAKPEILRIQAIETPTDTVIKVPYSITLDTLPQGVDSVLVRGVIFTRPVNESSCYGIDTIWAEFVDSDFISDSTRALWLQKYHPNIPIRIDTSYNDCNLDTNYTHPLEVGVFHKDSAVFLKAEHKVINCIVVLEEPYSPSNTGSCNLNSLPLVLSNINVIIYSESNGSMVPLAAKCSVDTHFIDADSLLDHIVRLEIPDSLEEDTTVWGPAGLPGTNIVPELFACNCDEQVVLTSGQDAYGSGGSASLSVGQVAYTTEYGPSRSSAQGIQQVYEITVIPGMNEDRITLNLSVFPNPTQGNLTLEILEMNPMGMRYQLRDLFGNLLEERELEGDITHINMHHLAASTYFLTITDNQQILKTFKILKK